MDDGDLDEGGVVVGGGDPAGSGTEGPFAAPVVVCDAELFVSSSAAARARFAARRDLRPLRDFFNGVSLFGVKRLGNDDIMRADILDTHTPKLKQCLRELERIRKRMTDDSHISRSVEGKSGRVCSTV